MTSRYENFLVQVQKFMIQFVFLIPGPQVKCVSGNQAFKWLENEPIINQKKFQPKPITGESEIQKDVRITFAKDEMKREIDVMRIKAQSYQHQYQVADLQVLHEID